jgi:hypothetical protein
MGCLGVLVRIRGLVQDAQRRVEMLLRSVQPAMLLSRLTQAPVETRPEFWQKLPQITGIPNNNFVLQAGQVVEFYVGGNAQVKAMKHKKVAGGLRLNLAAFRELEAFAQLGTELDPATQRQLDRGLRMVELLKQDQYTPYPYHRQIVSIFAGTQGLLDDLPARRVHAFEADLLRHFDQEFPELFEEIEERGDLPDELAAKIKQVIVNFKAHWGEESDG